eukprot:gene3706-13775_t
MQWREGERRRVRMRVAEKASSRYEWRKGTRRLRGGKATRVAIAVAKRRRVALQWLERRDASLAVAERRRRRYAVAEGARRYAVAKARRVAMQLCPPPGVSRNVINLRQAILSNLAFSQLLRRDHDAALEVAQQLLAQQQLSSRTRCLAATYAAEAFRTWCLAATYAAEAFCRWGREEAQLLRAQIDDVAEKVILLCALGREEEAVELPRAQIDDVAEEGLSTESTDSSCGGMKAQLATCFNLASLLASSGKLQEASQFVEKAMQIDPTSQETRLLAGAGQAMEEAMRIDPTYQKTGPSALWVELLSGY